MDGAYMLGVTVLSLAQRQEVRALGVSHRRLPQTLIRNEEQVAVLNAYIYAKELYLRCLEVVAVKDHQVFKERVILLPRNTA